MIKIVTRQSGIIKLTRADLVKAGFSENDFDLNQASLTHRGQEQAVWVVGQTGGPDLYFYAAPSDSPTTLDNVYLLGWGAGQGKRMVEQPAQPVEGTPASTALASQHFEVNERYSPIVEEGDHWLWLMLPAPGEEEIKLHLEDAVTGPGSLKVEVWASTEAPVSPDHHLKISLNGVPVLDEAWDGRGRHRLSAILPDGILVKGENTVWLQATGDSGAPADIVFVDWIDIGYTRDLIAREGNLVFESQGQPQVLRGFGDPISVFDVTDVENIHLTGNKLPVEKDRMIFTGISGHRYQAVDQSGFIRPEHIQAAALVPDLMNPPEGADYIAIGPEDLLEPLQPLLDLRKDQGLKPQKVPLEAVYDQFGFGLPEGEAIHRFLQHAARAWKPAPRYVLLVGDTTYDPRGYRSGSEANRLPTLMFTTESGGETASDVRLALIDDNGWPDLALGRLPARNPQQVQIYVKKILAYEQGQGNDAWRATILAVADGHEPGFSYDAQQLLDLFPEEYRKTLYNPPPGVNGAAQKIAGYLDDGALFVFYFGHGSLTLWGKDRLFSGVDTAGLHNAPRLPIIVTMTCLTGLFTHPEQESISESLLWQKGGGAIALLAPTSLTLALDQSFLSTALVKAYLQNPAARWGDIVLAAQRQVPLDSAGPRDVLMTFHLFGDPALKLVRKD